MTNTRFTGIKSALTDWKRAADLGDPNAIYLDIPTAEIYTDTIINPSRIGLRIDNVVMAIYGNISMETIRNYCNSKIYSTAILLDVDNIGNAIYSHPIHIDSYVAFGGANIEPQIQQIHIDMIGDDRANKFIQCADWIFDQQIEIDCAENRIDTMTATASIYQRPDGKFTHQVTVTEITYNDGGDLK